MFLNILRQLKRVPASIWFQMIVGASSVFANLKAGLKEKLLLVVVIVVILFGSIGGLTYHQYSTCVDHDMKALKSQSKWKTKSKNEWLRGVQEKCKKTVW